jgi:TPR repeat protein
MQQAVHWYNIAASNGDVGAYNTLGVLYQVGDGVKQDVKKAFDYFSSAANLGFARAMSNLGDMYMAGDGVPADGEKALMWYNRAIENGFTYPMKSIPMAKQLAESQKKIIKKMEKKGIINDENLNPAEVR